MRRSVCPRRRRRRRPSPGRGWLEEGDDTRAPRVSDSGGRARERAGARPLALLGCSRSGSTRGLRWAARWLGRAGWRAAGGKKEGHRRTSKVWVKNENKSERDRREREKGKGVLLIFEKQQTNEFKYKFEFKHFKTMHQPVCNSKMINLFYFKNY
jgi:hypothetical protein